MLTDVIMIHDSVLVAEAFLRVFESVPIYASNGPRLAVCLTPELAGIDSRDSSLLRQSIVLSSD